MSLGPAGVAGVSFEWEKGRLCDFGPPMSLLGTNDVGGWWRNYCNKCQASRYYRSWMREKAGELSRRRIGRDLGKKKKKVHNMTGKPYARIPSMKKLPRITPPAYNQRTACHIHSRPRGTPSRCAFSVSKPSSSRHSSTPPRRPHTPSCRTHGTQAKSPSRTLTLPVKPSPQGAAGKRLRASAMVGAPVPTGHTHEARTELWT